MATLLDTLPRAKRLSISERFAEFDAANGHVYSLFKGLARQARDAGMKRYGAHAILEVLRWKLCVETGGDSGFRLNDQFTSRYARKLIAEDPSFRDFFELRKIRSE